jgi:hypothetical protein
MTPEQRLDRLERIAKLLVRAGMRARREMNEKINILLDAQIRNDERFAKTDERFAKTDEKFARLAETSALADEKFAQIMKQLAEKSAETDDKFARLVEAQTHSDRKLDALIDVIRKEREERRGDSG